MRRSVLWDSSAIVAFLDADDADHPRACDVSRAIARDHRPSFTTNFVQAEAHALLLRKLGRRPAREWLVGGGLAVVRIQPFHEERAREILLRYDDKDFSLCDALSFAVMEARSVRTAFSFDHHFRQYGRFEVLGLPR
ncbi:MAG: PIN domain-containing protein [Myxococcota bacterium]